MTRQARMEAWITPLEVSLLLSIKQQTYISPDDIKQLRRAGRIKASDYRQISEHLTLYRRSAMTSENAPKIAKKTNSKSDITLDLVVKWLENFPLTVAALEQSGNVIIHKSQAQQIVEERKAEKERKQVLAEMKRKTKTAIKTS